MRSFLYCRLSLLALTVGVALVTAESADKSAAFDAMASDYLAEKQFMGTVLVAQDGTVLLDRGYGLADAAKGVSNTPATRFFIGSITKQFTAAAILLLEEQGKLHVQDPVGNYLPDPPAAWQEVTLFHLLTHASGIPNFTDLPNFERFKSEPHTPEQLVALFRDQPLQFPPGEKWAYSNSGYALLGWVIERVSGQTYGEFLRTNIFEPLSMHDSGYHPGPAVVAGGATGYQGWPPAGLTPAPVSDTSTAFSAGGIYSTTGDLQRWITGLFDGRLLRPESLTKMITNYRNTYGFGIGVMKLHGHSIYGHGGAIDGFGSALYFMPHDHLTVIVLSNLAGPGADQLDQKLVQLAVGEAVERPSERKGIVVAPEVLARYVGTYAMGPGADMQVAVDVNGLTIQLPGQAPLPLVATSEVLFESKTIAGSIEFKFDAEGRATHFILRRGGSETPIFRKQETAQPVGNGAG